jgi:hypothetical protein
MNKMFLLATGILMLLGINFAYGQNYAFDPLLTKCVIHHDDRLVILTTKDCDGWNDSIIYYSNQGYEIKATLSNPLGTIKYMQK